MKLGPDDPCGRCRHGRRRHSAMVGCGDCYCGRSFRDEHFEVGTASYPFPEPKDKPPVVRLTDREQRDLAWSLEDADLEQAYMVGTQKFELAGLTVTIEGRLPVPTLIAIMDAIRENQP